jgi:hypothetical protein
LTQQNHPVSQVNTMKICTIRQAFLLCIILILVTACSGCARRSAEEAGIDEHLKTYYYDAELSFAIEHPADWQLVRGQGEDPESCTVRWQSPPDPKDKEPLVRAEVVACPGVRWPGGNEEMREDFLSAHPNLALSEEKEIELPGGNGLMLVGADPMRTYKAVFLRSTSRGYILTFSTPNAKFDSYRPLFAEVLDSFQPQGER